jgi:hypothetical protein
MGGFIGTLRISGESKAKLRRLGAETPFALLSLIEAAPKEFAALMGNDAPVAREQVAQLVPPSQLELLSFTPAELPLGAELSPAPKIADPPYNISLRDRLFDEWQELLKNPKTRNSQAAKELENHLNLLLEP